MTTPRPLTADQRFTAFTAPCPAGHPAAWLAFEGEPPAVHCPNCDQEATVPAPLTLIPTQTPSTTQTAPDSRTAVYARANALGAVGIRQAQQQRLARAATAHHAELEAIAADLTARFREAMAGPEAYSDAVVDVTAARAYLVEHGTALDTPEAEWSHTLGSMVPVSAARHELAMRLLIIAAAEWAAAHRTYQRVTDRTAVVDLHARAGAR